MAALRLTKYHKKVPHITSVTVGLTEPRMLWLEKIVEELFFCMKPSISNRLLNDMFQIFFIGVTANRFRAHPCAIFR